MNTMSEPILVADPEVPASANDRHGTMGQVRSVSGEMQKTLVPALSYQGPRVEAYGRSVPKDDVGGDLVDLVADGREVTAYVAGVSGHGLRAGILMAMIKTAVRYGLLLGRPLTKLLDDINHVLPDVKEPHMFATLAALRFDRPKQVEYISAGHVPLLHYRQSTGDVVRHCTSQFPLGLFAGDGYTSRQIPYQPGDIFVLVTDGVLESSQDRDADSGVKRLMQIIRELAGRPLSEIVEAIHNDLKLNGKQDDDQTVLLVRAARNCNHNNPDVASKPDQNLASNTELAEATWRRLLDDLAEELSRD